MKKTIEEVASWYANELIDSKTIESHEKSWVSSIFIAGAKYQSEQMYSEEEVRNASLKFFFHWYNTPGNNTEQGFDNWFSQFKKK